MLTTSNRGARTVRICFVLALWFFCNPIFSHSFSASSNFTHIYSDASGTSLFCDVRAEGELSFPHFSAGLKASYSHIYSSLEKISAAAHFFDAGVFAKTQFVDFSASVFFLNADDLLLHIDKDYKLEKIAAFGMSFSLPIKFPCLTVAPIFSFGNMKSQNGNMHYFYSEPKIPLFYAAGAKLEIGRLKLAALYASADIDFYADEQNGSEKLIGSDIWAVGFFSNYEIIVKNFRIVPSLGFFHLDAQANGVLTAQNQKYFLFPYSVFNLAGNAKIDALIFGANFSFEKSFYKISADFAALLCVNQTGSYGAEYLYKKNLFFDGSQGNYSGEIKGLAGNGISFLTISADFSIPIKKATLVLSPKKIFLIPLFFNSSGQGVSQKGDSGVSDKEKRDLALRYLLSGLSFSAKLYY